MPAGHGDRGEDGHARSGNRQDGLPGWRGGRGGVAGRSVGARRDDRNAGDGQRRCRGGSDAAGPEAVPAGPRRGAMVGLMAGLRVRVRLGLRAGPRLRAGRRLRV